VLIFTWTNPASGKSAKEWSWLTRRWQWFDVLWFGSCCPIQRVVGKDLENLCGSSQSSLGCSAVFQKSFGDGSLSHGVPYFLFVHKWHLRGLPQADLPCRVSGHIRTAGRSITSEAKLLSIRPTGGPRAIVS
jgi:hypothetical protein